MDEGPHLVLWTSSWASSLQSCGKYTSVVCKLPNLWYFVTADWTDWETQKIHNCPTVQSSRRKGGRDAFLVRNYIICHLVLLSSRPCGWNRAVQISPSFLNFNPEVRSNSNQIMLYRSQNLFVLFILAARFQTWFDRFRPVEPHISNFTLLGTCAFFIFSLLFTFWLVLSHNFFQQSNNK